MGKMRSLAAAAFSAALVFTACSNNMTDTFVESLHQSRAAKTYNAISGDSGAISFAAQYNNMYTIDGTKVKNGWNFAYIDLSAFNGQTVTIDFGASMQIDNKGNATTLYWNTNDSSYTPIATVAAPKGSSSWSWVSGSKSVKLGSGNSMLYLSSNGLTPSNFRINVSSISITVTGSGSSSSGGSSTVKPISNDGSWTSVTSLKSVYSKHFAHFGFEVSEKMMNDAEIRKGLQYHGNTTTMENEFKPDFIFNWVSPNASGTFNASNGLTIRVPSNTPVWTRPDSLLKRCKDLGIQMRGHVLVWHSQTPEWFFRQNYNANAGYVSANEMNARLEWYIKTVLEHVSWWERTYNGGKHIIYAWDVVNEAVADDASGSNWLRGSSNNTRNKSPAQGGSSWYKVYGNADFIINAFRYANKYAPKDVELCYNDYNSYMDNKTDGILKLISAVQSYSNASYLPSRIDAMGMQSHVGLTWPSASGYENAVKKFLAKGIDVQVTELDVGHGTTPYNATSMQNRYKELFKVFIRNKKSGSRHGISGVTIWGVNDEDSWIKAQNGVTQYPLLFQKKNGKIVPKATYYGVLEAAN